ncbi:MAG TPA: hypothetical protein VFO73_14090 [Candidatus Limnocylindrales bacterium]|nr:hypothetical protein [Candidatus Limnocylindrales bacterium]
MGRLARALVVAILVGACTESGAPARAPDLAWDVRDAPGVVADVAVAGDLVVAVGATAPTGDPSGRPAVWLSEDGRTWESATIDGDGEIAALVVGDEQHLAAGNTRAGAGTEAAVWASSDGREWTKVAGDAFAPEPGCSSTRAEDIAAGTGGYVAVGTEWGGGSCGQHAAAWLSPDGRTWSRAEMAPGSHAMHNVVGGPDGYVAAGAGKASANEGTRGAFVFSPDGRAWTQAPDQEGLRGAEPQAVVADPLGYLAIGMAITDLRSGAMAPAAWRSSDGRAWDRLVTEGFTWDAATTAAGQPDQQVVSMALTSELVAIPSGLLALGSGMTRRISPDGATQQASPWQYLAWISDSGDTWTRVPDDPALLVGAVSWYVLGPSAAVVHDDRLLLFGTRWPASVADQMDMTGRPTIWETDATAVGGGE